MAFDRRSFLKFGAGATAGILATPLVWKALDDVSIWSQNWPWIPANEKGENSYAVTVSKTCPSAVPMVVRLVGGRPVRILPLPEHPLGGGVTALAEAEVQMLHSPARVKKPLLRSDDGAYVEADWGTVHERLKNALLKAGKDVAYLSGDENGTVNEVMSALAGKAGSEAVYLMPSEGRNAALAASLMGLEAQLGYDLENSDFLLAVGANILESWGTVARNRRIFAEKQPHPGAQETAAAALAYAGPLQNNTAGVASLWVPIAPGTETALLLCIANHLIAKGARATADNFDAFAALAKAYTPEATAKICGTPPARLAKLLEGISGAKAPLVIAGGDCAGGAGAAPVMAAFTVNALLGNINKPGGVKLLPFVPTAVSGAKSRAALYKNDPMELFSGKKRPAMLVIHEANPAYALPDGEKVRKALKDIPFKVSFSTFFDETAALCDLVIPIGMGLERIDDVVTPYGCGKNIYAVGAPVVDPVVDVRNTGDALLLLAKELGWNLGFEKYSDLLQAKADAAGANFELLVQGQPSESDATAYFGLFTLNMPVLEKAAKYVPNPAKPALALYSKLSLGTAKTGIPPFNTKTIRAAELAGPDMYVMVNGATASALGLKQDDRVLLKANNRSILARLRVFEGVVTGSVGVCLGYGHTALDAFSQNKGANALELLSAEAEPETGLTVWSRTGVEVVKA